MSALLLNPYADVDFGAITREVSSSHMHAKTQPEFDGYYARGVRGFAITNYFPSQPTCPLEEFFTIPSDTICVPASECHGFLEFPQLHMCALGSDIVVAATTGLGWAAGITAILDELAWPDGGGVVIAHPVWSLLDTRAVARMLDWDDRVLGLEAYNNFVENNPDYSADRQASAMPMWDELLHSARRCWGFFVPDHKYTPGTFGKSVLLLPTVTSEAAALAWRDGRFYGALAGTGLDLEGVDVDGDDDHVVTITTDSADEIRMITSPHVTTTASGPVATFTVPDTARYARFEAENEADTIYTQALMYDLSRYDIDDTDPNPYEMTAARDKRAHFWFRTTT